MRCVLITAASCVLAASASASPRAEWERLDADKRAHVEVSARLGLLFGAFVYAAPHVQIDDGPPPLTQRERLAIASAACLAPGVGKEALDELLGAGADPLDLAADVAGCAVGIGAGAAGGTALRFLVVEPLVERDGTVGAVARWRF